MDPMGYVAINLLFPGFSSPPAPCSLQRKARYGFELAIKSSESGARVGREDPLTSWKPGATPGGTPGICFQEL